MSAPKEMLYINKYRLRLDFKKKSLSDIITLTLPIIKEMNSLERVEIIVLNNYLRNSFQSLNSYIGGGKSLVARLYSMYIHIYTYT